MPDNCAKEMYRRDMVRLSGKRLVTELTGALVELVSAARDLAHMAVSDDVPSASEAAARLADPLNKSWWRGTNAVHNVHEDIAIGFLAGRDNAYALAQTLRTNQTAAVSLATLTRGCIEATSRAYWLLRSVDAREMLVRDSELAFDDLDWIARVNPTSSMQKLNGTKVMTPGELRQQIVEYLRTVGRAKPERVSRMQLAAALLEDAAPSASANDGKAAYSGLSAASHGQFYAVNYFLNWDPAASRGHQLSLKPTDDSRVEYTAEAHACISHVGTKLADYFVPTGAERERWITARDRSSLRRARAHLG